MPVQKTSVISVKIGIKEYKTIYTINTYLNPAIFFRKSFFFYFVVVVNTPLFLPLVSPIPSPSSCLNISTPDSPSLLCLFLSFSGRLYFYYMSPLHLLPPNTPIYLYSLSSKFEASFSSNCYCMHIYICICLYTPKCDLLSP